MRFASLLLSLVLVGSVASAAAGTLGTLVKVDGVLVGPALPSYWRILGAALVGHDGKIYIRVDAEGNCRTEWRQECHTLPNGQVVCNPVSQWVCDQSYALFLMPSSVRIEGKNVLYTEGQKVLKIGVVKSFLIWKWISLDDAVRLQASPAQAALLMDVDRLSPPTKADREETFVKLHGRDGQVDLMVGFRDVSNAHAREMLRQAGYHGEFAPLNTWTGADPTRDQIGVRVTPSEGSALLSRLQNNPLITGIKPYVADK